MVIEMDMGLLHKGGKTDPCKDRVARLSSRVKAMRSSVKISMGEMQENIKKQKPKVKHG